jgi:hypothetical protein
MDYILFSCPTAKFIWACFKEALLGWDKSPGSLQGPIEGWVPPGCSDCKLKIFLLGVVLWNGNDNVPEQFSVKIFHMCCSSFRECSDSGNGNGNENMAAKRAVSVELRHPTPKKTKSDCDSVKSRPNGLHVRKGWTRMSTPVGPPSRLGLLERRRVPTAYLLPEADEVHGVPGCISH